MNVAARIKHYVAVRTYEARRAWRYFYQEARELQQYWSFRLKRRSMRSWHFRLLARLFSKCVPEGKGFGDNEQKTGAYVQAERLRARARRRLASVFLCDAQREENSIRTRADLAYEAAYLYALARLGVEADQYTHPEPAALNTAAELMGWTEDQMAPAIAYAMQRYAPSNSEAEDRVAFCALLDIAQKMQGHIE